MSEGFDPSWLDGEEDFKAEPVTLERLTKLAEEARQLEKDIDAASVDLAEKQDKLTNILRNIIPSAMEELGMKNFTLADESKVEIKDHINASITEQNKPRAFAWLTEHGFDGIIKTKVASEFGKGEIDDARKALSALQEAGFTGTLDQNVHPMTLKSFVKEQLEEGNSIPLDVFGVFEFKEAKITRPREKRARRK
jgi:hypothetical protein